MRVEAEVLLGGSGLNWGNRDREGAGLRKYCSDRVPGLHCLLEWGMKSTVESSRSRLEGWGDGECWILLWPVEPAMSGTNR